MNYYKIILTIILFQISFCSCGQSISDNEARRDDFDSYQNIYHKFKTSEDDVFLGRPQSINLIGSWLAITDAYDEHLVTLISNDFKKSKRGFRRGVGPGEFFGGIIFIPTLDSKKVMINHRNANKFITYSTSDVINDNLETPSRVDSIFTKGLYTTYIEKGYVIAEAKPDNKLFSLVNRRGKEIKRFGDYPGKIGSDFNAGEEFLSMYIQNIIASNPDKNIVAAGGFNSDLLCFYQIDENGNSVLLNQYHTYDPKITVEAFKEGYGASAKFNENTRDAYTFLCPTKNHLFALYRGYLMKERKNNPYCYIQVFDWDGNFIKGYKTDIRISSMAVDEEKGIAYGLIGGENPAICTFQLEGLN